MSATGSPTLRRILIAIAVGGWPVPDVTSAQETWRLADRPAVTIGSVARNERYSLDYVRSIVRTAAGNVAIADGDSGVRIYSAAGEYVSRFGEASGPGEARDVRTMFAYRGDSIAIAHSRARICSLSSDLMALAIPMCYCHCRGCRSRRLSDRRSRTV